MFGDLRIYGGFSISPYLASRVFEVVGEIHARNIDREISHLDDQACPLCRPSAVETGNDATERGGASHLRAA